MSEKSPIELEGIKEIEEMVRNQTLALVKSKLPLLLESISETVKLNEGVNFENMRWIEQDINKWFDQEVNSNG